VTFQRTLESSTWNQVERNDLNKSDPCVSQQCEVHETEDQGSDIDILIDDEKTFEIGHGVFKIGYLDRFQSMTESGREVVISSTLMSLQAGGDHAAMAWVFKTQPAASRPPPSTTPVETTSTSTEHKIKRHDKVGVQIQRKGEEHEVVGTVTAVMGDTATVQVPSEEEHEEYKTVDRYLHELWLLPHDTLESMNMTEDDDDEEDDSNLITIKCKDGKTVKVTPEQHAYLVKTFTEPVRTCFFLIHQ